VGTAKDEAKAGDTLLPVVMLHDGPGLCSRYLEPMELLGQTARRLVFYDQFGSGFSSRGAPPGGEYKLQLFVDQVRTPRLPVRTLGFGDQ
jgi:pimeloyl-ACP methyl ester carboxylesterase